jgi:hypothetical protein
VQVAAVIWRPVIPAFAFSLNMQQQGNLQYAGSVASEGEMKRNEAN